MRHYMAFCLVLLALMATACNQDSNSAKPDKKQGKKPSSADAKETAADPSENPEDSSADPTAGLPKQAAADLGNGVKLDLVLIPAGRFAMGNHESSKATAAFFNKIYGDEDQEFEAYKDERPQHLVRISRPFYMGVSHVTRGQFRQFVAETGYKTDAEKGEVLGASGWDAEKKDFDFNEKYNWQNAGFEQADDHPVVNVSWNDAVAFCAWLSKKEGKTYRLPTEAEWEYACRAGTTTRYSSGDDPESLVAVGNTADAAFAAELPDWDVTIRADDGYVFTSPVGKFRPNAFGLYDMHGNAWQWCADWYGEEFYAVSPERDPTGPESGKARVLRGGAWFKGPYDCRSAVRNSEAPGVRFCGSGFRVVRVD